MKIASIQPKYLRQAAEKTKKKAFKQALRRTNEAAGTHTATQGTAPFLELYQKESCPFSHAVRNRLTELGLDFVSHTVPDGNAFKHEQLSRAGGRDQIPFLTDRKTGVKLYDSSTIIGYLDHEYGQPRKGTLSAWAHEIDLRLRSRTDQLAWAIRTPFERAKNLVDDISESLNTLRRSYKIVRKVIQAPITEKEMKKAA